MARKLAHTSGTPTGGPLTDGLKSQQTKAGFKRRSYLTVGLATALGLFASTSQAAGESAGTSREQHELNIIGTGEVSNFHFTVDQSLEPVSSNPQDGRGISGTSAEGVVSEGERCFRFSGEIQHLAIDGSAAVLLDGEPVSIE